MPSTRPPTATTLPSLSLAVPAWNTCRPKPLSYCRHISSSTSCCKLMIMHCYKKPPWKTFDQLKHCEPHPKWCFVKMMIHLYMSQCRAVCIAAWLIHHKLQNAEQTWHPYSLLCVCKMLMQFWLYATNTLTSAPRGFWHIINTVYMPLAGRQQLLMLHYQPWLWTHCQGHV